MTDEKTTRPVVAERMTVGDDEDGERLDVFLARRLPEVSRRRARVLVAAGAVSVDGRRVMVQSRTLHAGQAVVCHVQDLPPGAAEALDPAAVLHEDESLIAIDKPCGIPSHATLARRRGSAIQLTEELLRRRAGSKVPLWALHRLDVPTSGVLLFAKTQAAARAVHQNLSSRRVRKEYLAIVAGTPEPPEGEIALPLLEGHLRTEVSPAGKEARTGYRVVERRGDESLVELSPETGRMHQLRVHLAAIGHPIVGDSKYGGRPGGRLLLHAFRIELPHPIGGGAFAVEAPPPADFRHANGRCGPS
jgi:23S rRNA pseudouridine1911/1915/1917 synthase